MAYELIKVSELPELTTPSDPNVLPIQDGDYLKRISFENLKEAATGDVAGDLAAEVTARESAVSGEATARGNADTAILADLASPYSASLTYAVGDYCTKDGQLYRCTTAISTAEAWTSGHWSAVALGNDTRDLRSALSHFDGDAKKIHVNANKTHSSSNDQLSVNIANGEKFLLTVERNYTNTVQVYGVDSSNNYALLGSSGVKSKQFLLTASMDIVKIGLTVSANSYADDYIFAVSKEKTNTYVLGQKANQEDVDAEIERVDALIDMNLSRNLIGADLDVLYPVPPLKTGDVLTISAFNPTGVTSYAQVRFHAADGTRLTYWQFDTNHATTGRRITLDVGESTVYFISIWHDCGSPLMVERGDKTDFIPHYTTNYERYLNSDSDFGEFELFLPDQAKIIRDNFATARMTKRLCFGHVSDNHSSLYPFICNIVDLSDAKFIVNTGDMVIDKYSDSYTNVAAMINAMTKPHYITLGNHDVYQAPSVSDIFTKYFSPIIAHNEQTSLDKTYYSVNFADEGIKCIFLDLYDALADYSASMNTIIGGKMSATQINWLMAELDSALTNSMHVCIFMHLSPEVVEEKEQKFFDVNTTTESRMATYKFIMDIIEAFLDGESVSFAYDGNSYSHTFASSGVFVGYFCGHMHCDCVGKLKGYNRQNAFSVTRPYQSPTANDKEGVYRHGSSKWGFSAFNYVAVDPNTRHVSIIRVLQQDTKYGFKRDFMTTEY